MSNNTTFIVENSLKNIKKLVVEVIENSDTIVDSYQLVQRTLENTEKENSKLLSEISDLRQEKTLLEKTIEDNKLMVEMYNKRSKELDERVKSFEQSNQKLESERKDLLRQLSEIKERENKLLEERKKIDADLEHINNERKVSIVSNFSKQLDDKNKYIMVLEKRIENYKKQLGLSPSIDHDTKSVRTTDMIEEHPVDEPIELVLEPVTEKTKVNPITEHVVEPVVESVEEAVIEQQEEEVIEIEMDDKIYYAIEGNPTIVFLKLEDESMGERVGILTEDGEFIEDPKPEPKKEKKSKKKSQ